MTWPAAGLRAVAVFVYFVVATVWLPDFVLKLDGIAGASAFVRDAVVSALWMAGLAGGLVLLRRAQRRGVI